MDVLFLILLLRAACRVVTRHFYPPSQRRPALPGWGGPGGWMFFFQSVKIETSCYETPCKKSELYLFNRGIAVVGLLMISWAISILI